MSVIFINPFLLQGGEEEIPASVTVIGAGDPSLDGEYPLDPEYPGIQPVYVNPSSSPIKLRNTGAGWVIDYPSIPIVFYSNPSTDALPPKTGWVPELSAPPGPVIAY